ncbi:MAG: 50S ribosomal protein L9 [Deltaproteobacteria bacterium]|nr:50S ribosomal protein L9 [Deltaproteobacteria bacterium]MBW2050871.1 50S ribosomal protein L9 [Deltaproteobacteria bacterium]MBW2140191.1 50S ribosomal protein L9 [Deltaproteobacteria bacterium]MBW2322682.1 50S ribosomal protein L9 [Deltaproteobacteria bacterium]
MKVILTQDVDNLGLTGQIIDVSRGYARNKLIPSLWAVEATPGNLKSYEKARTEFEIRSMKEKERAQKHAQQIESIVLTIAQKAGEKDKLYGSVTSMDLVEAMSEQGLEMDRRKIKLAEPIKTLGDYEIPIRLHSEVTATIKVSVIKAED